MSTTNPCVVGTAAPQLDLQSATPDRGRGSVKSKDYLGRWLAILFYPRDFSFVCPTELTGFSAEKPEFDRRQCELLGISIDSVDSHLQWLATPEADGGVAGLQFPLASDPGGNACQKFGLWREEEGLPNRGLFLIDPSGVLRYAASYDLSVGRNVDDVLRALDALQAGGLCPSNWKRADGVLDIASMLQPGRVLGHYRVQKELGRGAFGQVLAADDLRLERKVALKVISNLQPQTESKLLKEARSAAGINHPNVCTVYSVDTIDTLPTIVMEYLDGGSLSDAISDGFDDQDFRKLAHQIALGLASAHARGIVHGDLKPANILLRESGEPVIVDFGLAQSFRRRAADSSVGMHKVPPKPEVVKDSLQPPTQIHWDPEETIDAEMTHLEAVTATALSPGGVSGTPAYMSPEQAHGNRLDDSSDIFSLGVILAQLLLREPPMANMSAIQIITDLQRKDFVHSFIGKIPEAFRADIADMLSVNPSDRPSAEDVSMRMR